MICRKKSEIINKNVLFSWNLKGILEKIEDAVEGPKKLHPAMKAVVIMKKLLLNAACGNPAEGRPYLGIMWCPTYFTNVFLTSIKILVKGLKS